MVKNSSWEMNLHKHLCTTEKMVESRVFHGTKRAPKICTNVCANANFSSAQMFVQIFSTVHKCVEKCTRFAICANTNFAGTRPEQYLYVQSCEDSLHGTRISYLVHVPTILHAAHATT